MDRKQEEPAALTPDQAEMADLLIQQCGLQTVADRQITMEGQSGSVYYGLGRCSRHLLDMTPVEIREMVMAKLHQQDQEQG